MRNRPAKIQCDCCGRRHDLRKVSPGTCARCIDQTVLVAQNWSSEDYLNSIENAGVRGSYGTYLNKVARLLGATDRRGLDWSSIDESTVVQVVKALGKKLGSSAASAFRGLREWFLENVPQPKPCGRIRVPELIVEVLGDLVKIGDSLFFKATMKNNRMTEFVKTEKTYNAFELEFLV